MRSLGVLLFAGCFLLAGCARSIPEEAKADLAKPIDCSTAEQDIATLEAEKVSAAERVSAGARSVVPSAAVVGVLRGDYGDRAAVASGKFNEDLEAKIAEIKQKCGLWP